MNVSQYVLRYPYHKVFADAFTKRFNGEYAAAISDDFIQNFAQLLHSLKINITTSTAISRSVFDRMNVAQLWYHTPLHILSCFSFAKEYNISLETWEQLALWGHDAIFEVGTESNEVRSANFLKSLLVGYLEPKLIDKVWYGIFATSWHSETDALENKPEIFKLLDLDICSFAWAKWEFDAASEAIASEFVPVYGQAKFKEGRKRFLQEMLNRGFIFRSPEMKQFDPQAQDNIIRAIVELALP